MKTITKIIGIFAIGFFALTSIEGKAINNYNFDKKCAYELKEIQPTGVKIKIKIDFGRKSRNCRGFGICSITFDIDIPILNDFFAFRPEGEPSNNLTIFCNEDTYEALIDQFSGENLIIEEDFTLDEEMTEELNLVDNFTIQTGEYPISPVEIEGEVMYSVTFE